MAIYMTARFQVKPDSLATCLAAIDEFVKYVDVNEPGTQLYTSLQDVDDQTSFLHYFVFDDEEAEQRHRTSAGVVRFTSILYPELVSDGVEFSRYVLAATTG